MESYKESEVEKPGEPGARPDFTTGGLFGHVVKLSIPSMLAMTFHQTYHFFDLMWLGRIGSEAQAAVTVYVSFWMVLAIFNQLVAMGSFTLIARSYGEKAYEKTSEIIGQTFYFKIAFSIPAVVLGYIFLYDAFIWFGVEPEVARLGNEYGRVMILAVPIYFSGFTLNTGFRSIGDVWKPVYLAGASMGLNIALDPLLIFGYGSWEGFGIAGAAYASVIAQSLFFVAGLYLFMSGKTYVRLKLEHMITPSLKWIRKFIRIGTPAAIGDACWFTSQFVIKMMVTTFGTAALAAFGIGSWVFQLAWIPLFGIDTAVSTLVGQNLGAKKPDRAEHTAIRGAFLAMGIIILIAAASFIFAEDFMRLFNDEKEVVETGSVLIRFAAFIIAFMSVHSGLGAAFWGSGDTVPVAVIMVIALWVIQIPLAYLLVWHLTHDIRYIWLAIFISELFAAVTVIYWFSKGKWKRKKV